MRGSLILIAFAGIFICGNAHADEAPIPHACSIEGSWLSCMQFGDVYDFGCAVDCGPKTAKCEQGIAFEIPNPGSSSGNCELFPSYCHCK